VTSHKSYDDNKYNQQNWKESQTTLNATATSNEADDNWDSGDTGIQRGRRQGVDWAAKLRSEFNAERGHRREETRDNETEQEGSGKQRLSTNDEHQHPEQGESHQRKSEDEVNTVSKALNNNAVEKSTRDIRQQKCCQRQVRVLETEMLRGEVGEPCKPYYPQCRH
jgi:hypothetical protein